MGIFRRSSRKDVNRIAAQVDELQSQLSSLRKDAKHLTDGLSRTAGAAMGTAEAAYQGVGKWTSDGVDNVSDWGRDQPLTACLVSLGIGAVLGMLFLRR
ncbi:MAG TPA: hypothetical protein VHY79_18820 [Rhizomicrobium sp.]|jgi:ElaB/YqjD/DUF883 family membrane-anchored ribosome-binding protein|nr:hypothetical protein [Rhizomicrobium sp.]